MTKAAKKGAEPRVADQILQGLKEALAFERGELNGVRVDRVRRVSSRHVQAEPPPAFEPTRIIDLRTNKMQLSQPVFAAVLNVSSETVKAWEQGKNVPSGAALRLLEIAEEDPAIVLGRVQIKNLDEEGKYRRQLPKKKVIHEPGSFTPVGRLMATAAKRDPSARQGKVFKSLMGSSKTLHGASAKSLHGARKAMKAAARKK